MRNESIIIVPKHHTYIQRSLQTVNGPTLAFVETITTEILNQN